MESEELDYLPFFLFFSRVPHGRHPRDPLGLYVEAHNSCNDLGLRWAPRRLIKVFQ